MSDHKVQKRAWVFYGQAAIHPFTDLKDWTRYRFQMRFDRCGRDIHQFIPDIRRTIVVERSTDPTNPSVGKV